jgi:hypothetical protein
MDRLSPQGMSAITCGLRLDSPNYAARAPRIITDALNSQTCRAKITLHILDTQYWLKPDCSIEWMRFRFCFQLFRYARLSKKDGSVLLHAYDEIQP